MAKIIVVSVFQIGVPIINHSTMKVIDPQEQIKKEKQKICMWLMNSKADIDDELLLNMSYAFFSEMKNAEEKKFKQFCEWRESDNLLGKKVVLVRVLVFHLGLFPNVGLLEQLAKWVPLF